ncbi:MAG: NAD(P)H-dependent oxidoreductase [Oligoflexia bacterium]|nr:NAD(P)H-dependent oxidoreductase [Oligoflexia bacterium]
MKTLIVYAHPNPKSFTAAIANTVAEQIKINGGEIKIKDLYRSGFNPIMSGSDLQSIFSGNIPEDIKREQNDVAWANRLIMVYPIWWLDKPALLKGWIDRVFVYGFAYTINKTGIEGLLKHDMALTIQLAGSPQAAYESKNWNWALTPSLTDRAFDFCGIKNSKVHSLVGVGSSTPEQRQEWLREVTSIVRDWN